MTLEINITPELASLLSAAAEKQGLKVDFNDTSVTVHLYVSDTAMPSLSSEESRLIDQINRGLSEAEWQRYRELIRRRQAEQITDAEFSELAATTDRIEELAVQRLKHLSELARLRNTTVPKLMEQLGITAPAVT